MNLQTAVSWFSILNPVVTIAATIFIAFRIQGVSNELQRYQTAATYIQILAKATTPPYVKALALASMSRFKLADPDFLFDVGYGLENREEPGIMQPLFYAYGSSRELAHSPIGSLTFHSASASGEFPVTGWALDDKGVTKIEVIVDGAVSQQVTNYGSARPDIEAIFRSYADPGHSGFGFTLAKPLVSGGSHVIAVRVWDREGRFRDICDRSISFSGGRPTFVPPAAVHLGAAAKSED